jgi:phospholipid/cholesterol/gamma-HCH transport system permease protein
MLALVEATLVRPLLVAGRAGEAFARHCGAMSLLVWRSLVVIFTGELPVREFIAQLRTMGVQSIPLVLVTAMLSGVVTTQQGGYQFTASIPMYVLGSVVASSVILELAPVMTAFVLIGRVGARITAELGTMQVSEQIDAMYSLGRDPVRYLAAPRLLAGLIATPILVAMADAAGIFAGMVAGRLAVGLGSDAFLYGARLFWHNWDLFYSLTKGLVFGFVIPLIATHMGLSTRGGAEGVGSATTRSVVFMILSVLVLDALFPPLLLNR